MSGKVKAIVESERVAPGESVLDYGCGDRPYEAIFRHKFRRYDGADLPGNAKADILIQPDSLLPVA
jgi:hypothetical protein